MNINDIPLDWDEFTIPKKSGGVRHICAPNEKLKQAQQAILVQLTKLMHTIPAIRPTRFAHGFIQYRNVVTSIKAHRLDSLLYICMDIKDFFDNINVEQVRDTLYKAGVNPTTVDTIITLAAYKGRFPQGGPLSPMLTNIAMRDVDNILASYANTQGFSYTRYADDILLSYKYDEMQDRVDWKAVCKEFDRILKKYMGLCIAFKKCHCIWKNSRRAPRQTLGVVFRKDGLGVNAPRKSRRAVRAGIHNLYKKLQNTRPTPADHKTWMELKGKVAWFDHVRSASSSEDNANSADPIVSEKEWNYLMGVFKK